ncbi:hypothetical protein V8V50_06770 [Ligilactobacillus salivarius]
MKKKLFLIFGPLVLAAVLLAVVLVTPFNFTKPDSEEIHEASLSQSNNIFKGTAVKKQPLNKIMYLLWVLQSYPVWMPSIQHQWL